MKNTIKTNAIMDGFISVLNARVEKGDKYGAYFPIPKGEQKDFFLNLYKGGWILIRGDVNQKEFINGDTIIKVWVKGKKPLPFEFQFLCKKERE